MEILAWGPQHASNIVQVLANTRVACFACVEARALEEQCRYQEPGPQHTANGSQFYVSATVPRIVLLQFPPSMIWSFLNYGQPYAQHTSNSSRIRSTALWRDASASEATGDTKVMGCGQPNPQDLAIRTQSPCTRMSHRDSATSAMPFSTTGSTIGSSSKHVVNVDQFHRPATCTALPAI